MLQAIVQQLPLIPLILVKRIVLVPHFREAEVDTYFSAFEHIASALRWPKEVWPLLLQCKLIGKAQEVCSALPLEESLQYESCEERYSPCL